MCHDSHYIEVVMVDAGLELINSRYSSEREIMMMITMVITSERTCLQSGGVLGGAESIEISLHGPLFFPCSMFPTFYRCKG